MPQYRWLLLISCNFYEPHFFNISRYFIQIKLLPNIFYPLQKFEKKREKETLIKEGTLYPVCVSITRLSTHRNIQQHFIGPLGTCDRPSSFHKISQKSSNPYIGEITGNWNSYLCDARRNKLNICSYTLPLLNKVPNLFCQYFYSIEILFVSFRGSKFSWLFFYEIHFSKQLINSFFSIRKFR